jgi:hypothetical protein
VLGGGAVIECQGSNRHITPGQAVFLPGSHGPVTMRGLGRVVVAAPGLAPTDCSVLSTVWPADLTGVYHNRVFCLRTARRWRVGASIEGTKEPCRVESFRKWGRGPAGPGGCGSAARTGVQGRSARYRALGLAGPGAVRPNRPRSLFP